MVSGLVSYTPLLFNGSKMSLSPGLIVNAILEILLFTYGQKYMYFTPPALAISAPHPDPV